MCIIYFTISLFTKYYWRLYNSRYNDKYVCYLRNSQISKQTLPNFYSPFHFCPATKAVQEISLSYRERPRKTSGMGSKSHCALVYHGH